MMAWITLPKIILNIYLLTCYGNSISGFGTEVGVSFRNTQHHRALTTRDFCNMEMFNVTCAEGEVILIEEARYGRMNIGRCMKGNYGYQGCSVDVHRILDAKCSGRSKCDFQVPDPVLYEMQPCPVDFTSYLEVTHSCIPVATGEKSICDQQSHQKIREDAGFISSSVAEKHGYGSGLCPWIIEAHPGQRINISLYNFGYIMKSSPAASDSASNYGPYRQNVCFEVAVITDGEIDKKLVSVCGGDPRESLAMWTKSHVAKIEIKNPTLLNTIGAFLFEFKVTGCANVRSPPDAWQQKNGDVIIVRCNNSAQTWHLICKGTEWVGETGNCSATPDDSNGWTLEQMFNADDSFPFGVLIAVSIGVAMGVIIGGILLCLITMYMKRQRRNCDGYVQPKDQQHICSAYPSPLPLAQPMVDDRRSLHNWLIDAGSCTDSCGFDSDIQRVTCRLAGTTIIPRMTKATAIGGIAATATGRTNSRDGNDVNSSTDWSVDFNSSENTTIRSFVASSHNSSGYSSDVLRPKTHFYESPRLG